MSEMIAAEPALRRAAAPPPCQGRGLGDPRHEVREAFDRRAADPDLTGCGTSEHAAMAIAALLNEALDPAPGGREVRAVQALETLARPLRRGRCSSRSPTRAARRRRTRRSCGPRARRGDDGAHHRRRGLAGGRALAEHVVQTGSRTRAGATRSATCRRSSWATALAARLLRGEARCGRHPLPGLASPRTHDRQPRRRRPCRPGPAARRRVRGRLRHRPRAGAEGRRGRPPADRRARARDDAPRASRCRRPLDRPVLVDTDERHRPELRLGPRGSRPGRCEGARHARPRRSSRSRRRRADRGRRHAGRPHRAAPNRACARRRRAGC